MSEFFCEGATVRTNLLKPLLIMLAVLPLFAVNRGRNVVDGTPAPVATGNAIVENYTVEDGLPNGIVSSVIRTGDGFMWFGTWYGVSRFDGLHFQNYTGLFSSKSDQPPRKVETMVEDGQGNIWVKTLDWRLSVLFKREDRFKNVENELKRYTNNLQIIKIQSDSRGHVLLLTKDKNLLLGSTTADGRVELRLIANSRGAIDKSSMQLRTDLVDIRNGYAAWVGRDYSIFAMPVATGRSAAYHNLAFYRQRFRGLDEASHRCTDAKGTVWALADGHLYGYNPKTHQQADYTLALSGKITSPVFCRSGNRLFVLTEAGEALCVNTLTMRVMPVNAAEGMTQGKPTVRYIGMLADPSGDLWLTTAGRGIYKVTFPLSQFRLIAVPDSGNNGIRSIFQLSDGDVWAGSRNKNLYIFDRSGQLKQTLRYADYGIGSVYNIMADSRGRLWLSTKGDGLVLATADASQPCGWRFRHFRHDRNNPSSIGGNNVYVTYEDSHRHIWVGTFDGGLNLLMENGDSITFYNKLNGMTHYPGYGLYMEVRNMVEDGSGRLWVGTIDGLMAVNTQFRSPADIRFDTFRDRQASPFINSDIYTLFRDSRKNVWVCAFGGGLSRMTGYDSAAKVPIFNNVGLREGMENDVVLSVVEDSRRQLWLAGSDRLSCYDEAARRVRTFGRSDGLPPIVFEEGAAMRNTNGELWMGSKEGILVFRPDGLMQPKDSFPVYIVGCTVNNQDIRHLDHSVTDGSITYSDEMRLSHDQNMLTLTFAVLDYGSQNNIICRHRLEGFDTDWHYDGRNRMASYSQVPWGEYTFVVEAADAANPSHPAVRRLHIVILPPWWATWWAYAIYFLLAIAAAVALFRYVRYQIRLKNDLYVQSKVAEFKRQFTMEQEDKAFMQRVKDAVEANVDKADFDMDALAGELGMSRSALFKRIKALTGESPSEFVRNYKLTKAVDLLTHSDRSITDVAYASGFSDVGYFGKCFRKKYGMSPRDYKNRKEN